MAVRSWRRKLRYSWFGVVMVVCRIVPNVFRLAIVVPCWDMGVSSPEGCLNFIV